MVLIFVKIVWLCLNFSLKQLICMKLNYVFKLQKHFYVRLWVYYLWVQRHKARQGSSDEAPYLFLLWILSSETLDSKEFLGKCCCCGNPKLSNWLIMAFPTGGLFASLLPIMWSLSGNKSPRDQHSCQPIPNATAITKTRALKKPSTVSHADVPVCVSLHRPSFVI